MSVKIVLLERNSAGTDISVDCFGELGEVTAYANTVTEAEVAERVGDADIIVCNKSPMREATLKNCPNVKLICELATGYDNCDLEYCKSRGIQVRNVVDYSTGMVAQHTFTLALALSQKLFHYDSYVKSGNLGYHRYGKYRKEGGKAGHGLRLQGDFYLRHGEEHLQGLSSGG